MSFKIRTLAVLCLSAVVSACGMLGPREEAPKVIELKKSKGCLSGVGSLVERFSEGDLSSGEWTQSWDCTKKSLRQFELFIRGSSPEGYTRADMKSFISRFLVTDHEVSDELVRAAFALKQSMIGGSNEVLAYAELQKFLKIIEVVKEETAAMIPLLKKRKIQATSEVVIELSESIRELGVRVGEVLTTDDRPDFSLSDAETLITELQKIDDWEIPTEWAKAALAVKSLLLAGNGSMIEGETWPILIERVSTIGGLMLAIQGVEFDDSKPGAQDEFTLEMIDRAETILKDSLARHRGVIPFSRLDNILDSLPDSVLEVPGISGGVRVLDRWIIKRALRPLFQHVLMDPTADGFTAKAISTAFGLARDWAWGRLHLARIFREQGLDEGGETAGSFSNAAMEYLQDLDEVNQRRVGRLINIAKVYRPLFFGSDNQITYYPSNRHSIGNLNKFHTFNILSSHMLRAYGTPIEESGASADRGRILVSTDDLLELLDDFKWLMGEIRMLDPMKEGLHITRFREAGLFTYTSNGDDWLDETEITYYLSFLVSAKNLSDRIRKTIEPLCVDEEAGYDVLDWPWQNGECFRENYFSRFEAFWDHFPGLTNYFRSIDKDKKSEMSIAMEKGARRYGYTNLPVASYDIQGLAAILHYLEAVFARIDNDGNQILDLDETLAAYPNFKYLLARVAKKDPSKDKLLTAVFTYTVKFGRPPEEKNIFRALHFLWWRYVQKPFWSISSARDKLYNVVPLLAGPGPKAGRFDLSWIKDDMPSEEELMRLGPQPEFTDSELE